MAAGLIANLNRPRWMEERVPSNFSKWEVEVEVEVVDATKLHNHKGT